MKTVVLNVQGDIERDCREDEVGVIVLQGPNVTPGYTDSQRNRELWVIDRLGEEWLNTGDLRAVPHQNLAELEAELGAALGRYSFSYGIRLG